jgi:hypothetical protein
MFDIMSIPKLLIFYMILIAVTSVKLDDFIHRLKKKTFKNYKKGKS